MGLDRWALGEWAEIALLPPFQDVFDPSRYGGDNLDPGRLERRISIRADLTRDEEVCPFVGDELSGLNSGPARVSDVGIFNGFKGRPLGIGDTTHEEADAGDDHQETETVGPK